ncbi:hypothetical protein DFH06DRAFT_10028 [Mycena polygramma]|nr:hypothetical protein DFH06DRAFT_10028 [Mycena polygramma]
MGTTVGSSLRADQGAAQPPQILDLPSPPALSCMPALRRERKNGRSANIQPRTSTRIDRFRLESPSSDADQAPYPQDEVLHNPRTPTSRKRTRTGDSNHSPPRVSQRSNKWSAVASRGRKNSAFVDDSEADSDVEMPRDRMDDGTSNTEDVAPDAQATDDPANLFDPDVSVIMARSDREGGARSEGEEDNSDGEIPSETQRRGQGHLPLSADGSEDGSSDSDSENDGSGYESSSIGNGEQSVDVPQEAIAALASFRNAHRPLAGHFTVFVHYIAVLRSDPEFFISVATDEEKDYFQTAINALRNYLDGVANSIRLQSWKAPFTATLDLRPLLHHKHHSHDPFPPKQSSKSYGCHACWTRGREACDSYGRHVLWTLDGTYNRRGDSFENVPEKEEQQYETETFFKNNALARNKPYAPNVKLIVGARCGNRARAYNDVRHYMYRVAAWVTYAIGDGAAFAENPDRFLDRLTPKLLRNFKSSKANWERFQNRYDSDEEWRNSQIV